MAAADRKWPWRPVKEDSPAAPGRNDAFSSPILYSAASDPSASNPHRQGTRRGPDKLRRDEFVPQFRHRVGDAHSRLEDRKGRILLGTGELFHRLQRILDGGKCILTHAGLIFRNCLEQRLLPLIGLG